MVAVAELCCDIPPEPAARLHIGGLLGLQEIDSIPRICGVVTVGAVRLEDRAMVDLKIRICGGAMGKQFPQTRGQHGPAKGNPHTQSVLFLAVLNLSNRSPAATPKIFASMLSAA
jgi:hypothetical protein